MSFSTGSETASSCAMEDTTDTEDIALEILSQATLRGGSPEPRFVIKTSSTFDSPEVRRSPEESRRHLIWKDLSFRRLARLGEMTLARMVAENHYNNLHRAEMHVLTSVVEAGESWTSLSAPYAYALASAVVASTKAKFDLHQARLQESLQAVEVIRDSADSSFSAMQEARRQFNSLLSFCKVEGITVEHFDMVCSPTSLPSQQPETPPLL